MASASTRGSEAMFLTGGGEMGALMRTHDWAATPLGPPEAWPQPLRLAIRLLLNTGHPMYVWWGPDLFCFYNDAYRQSIGPERHPSSLGRPAREVWAEIWDIIGPQIEQVMSGGGATWHENQLVPITRVGVREEVYWTYSYGPIDDEGAASGVGGVLVVCTETTQTVLAERRNAFLLQLGDALRPIADPGAAIAAASEALGRHLGVAQVAYAEVEPGGETVTIKREWNTGSMAANRRRHQLADYGADLIADLRRGNTVALSDVALDSRTSSPQALVAFGEASIVGLIDVPVVKAGRLVAILGVHSERPRFWSAEEVKLAEEIAERTWAAAERVRAQAEVTAGEERFREFAEAASDTLWIVDAATGRLDYLSPAFERVWGEPRDGVMSDITRWAEFVHPDDRKAACDALPNVVAGERVANEYRIVRTDGEVRWILDVGFPIRDASGQVTRVGGIAQDLTERRVAEDALRASEERYRTLFEAIDAGFCVIEVLFDGERAVDYRFVEVNPAFERQTGLVSAVGRRMRELAAAHEDHWFEIYGRVARTGEPARFESEAAALGRWYDVHAFRTGAPEEHRVAILFTDIADRKAAEVALRTANETLERRVADALSERRLLAEIVEGTDAFVQVADLEYRWLAINKAAADEFERIYGVRPMPGDSMLDLLADRPEHQAAIRRVWGRALAGEEFTEVAEFGDLGREQRSYEMKYNVLRDDEGHRIGAYQFVYDVTARIVEQRRLAEAEEALRQSQKMEAMGQLTGGVAHDFNNLLTPIIGSLDMLVRRGVGSERERRLIDGALQSADRAKTLVQRLLAFARRQPLQPSAVDLGALIHGMAGLIGSTLGPIIDVQVALAENLPPAKVDPNQLEMALLNLAVNARDAMPDGGVLTIEAGRESVQPGHSTKLRQGHYLLLCVTDTGSGMDEATRVRAIEPFFSTKGIGQGTGLGLSMVHGSPRSLAAR